MMILFHGCTPWRRAKCRALSVACMAILLLIIAVPSLIAQDLGSISGTVTDPSGASVPGVNVTVTNQKTGVVVRKVTTNSAGSYTIAALPVSTYTITAQASGFKTAARKDIIVNVASAIRADFHLTLGAMTQEVSVTSPAVHLQTENGVVSQTISSTHVSEIDTNGRNFVKLATLVPGAVSQLPSFNIPTGISGNTTISFNGEEPDHNVWSIDGVENYDRGSGIEQVPDQDAIQEFKVETSNTGQNVGFGSGAQVQVEIKSGTDAYHGEAFEFNRNTTLDASTFFANASNTPKPTLNFNDYGFNLGGPLALPHHKAKTFFFFSADWRPLVQGSTIFAPGVPTAWTTGAFSSYGNVILNHNAPVLLPNGQTGYQPLAGNQIPSSMINSNAALLAKPNLIFNSPNSGQFFAG